MRLIPRKLFLTDGVGVHKEKLSIFELALRDAGIAHYNLVRVPSIFPPTVKSSRVRTACSACSQARSSTSPA